MAASNVISSSVRAWTEAIRWFFFNVLILHFQGRCWMEGIIGLALAGLGLSDEFATDGQSLLSLAGRENAAVANSGQVEAFQRHLFRYRKPDGQPLAWSSQHLHLKEVKQFFSWLAKHNHIPFSPACEIELPKQPKTLPKAILSADEVERILQQPDTTTALGLRDRAIFEVLYSTGIRRAEVCALQIDHVHVDRQVLFVNQGKGQKDRYVPIGLRALLWIARYVEQAREFLAIDSKERTLFLTNDGKPINPDSLTEYGRRYIKAASINKPGACHIFRHTMATLMHDAGADIRTIQEILGHAKLDTTQIYTRVSLKKLLETHQKTHPAEQPDQPPSHPLGPPSSSPAKDKTDRA